MLKVTSLCTPHTVSLKTTLKRAAPCSRKLQQQASSTHHSEMSPNAASIPAASSEPQWIQRSMQEALSSSHRSGHRTAESLQSASVMTAGLAILALCTLPAFGLMRHAQAVMRTTCIVMRVLPVVPNHATLQSLSPAVQAWFPATCAVCATMLLALLLATTTLGAQMFLVAAAYTVSLCGGEFAACVAAARQRPAASRPRKFATAAGVAGLQAFILLHIWREISKTNSAWLLALVAGNGVLCCLSSLAALTS